MQALTTSAVINRAGIAIINYTIRQVNAIAIIAGVIRAGVRIVTIFQHMCASAITAEIIGAWVAVIRAGYRRICTGVVHAGVICAQTAVIAIAAVNTGAGKLMETISVGTEIKRTGVTVIQITYRQIFANTGNAIIRCAEIVVVAHNRLVIALPANAVIGGAKIIIIN